MAIEKGIYTAPTGLEDIIGGQEPALELAVSAPAIVELGDGSVEITLNPESKTDVNKAPFDANLAEYVDEGVLATLSGDLLALIDADVNSRKDWADTFVKGLEVLGFKYEERSDPWLGSCGVFSTVLAEAAIRFQAETMSETFPAMGPVKTKILGEVKIGRAHV